MFTHQEIDELTIPLPETFIGFQPFEDLLVYEQNLPHWRQENATYAVTFRLADSIPKDVLKSAMEDLNLWKQRLQREREKARSRPENSDDIPSKILAAYREFLRNHRVILEHTLDQCYGTCLLRRDENQTLMERSLFHFDKTHYHLFAYVVMPNHCHVVVQPFPQFALEDVIGSWKKFTSRRMVGKKEAEAESGKYFWQRESHDRIVRDETHFRNAARYILKNPLKANLSESDFAYYVCGAKGFENRREEVLGT